LIDMGSTRVAFQGEAGAYSEAAALAFFGSQVETIACHNFDDVFACVSSTSCQFGIIPIENSLAGSIHRNYDLLLRNNLHLVGEHYLRVSHCLLALPGVELDEIKTVHSHPQALAQCEANLSSLPIRPIAEADTAGSAKLIREMNDRTAAALASHRAASVYQLEILVENMEDNPANFTRFLALASPGEILPDVAEAEYKTSIVFSLHNQPGSLFKALSVFALRDIDLTKIESRPMPGRPWEYLFYIDFIGSAQNQVCTRAIAHLEELAPFLRILGSYPRHITAESG